MQKKFDTDVENTQDANDVKAVLCVKPHSRNTIVGLSLLGLSLIFKGQHCSKRNNRGDAQWSLKKRSSSKQFTISKEKIYRNLPITLVPAHSLWELKRRNSCPRRPVSAGWIRELRTPVFRQRGLANEAQ